MDRLGTNWVDALAGGRMPWLWAVALGCMVAIALLAVAAWRTGRLKRTAASLHADCRAVATVEFTLVFPILLFLILLLTQTTTLMGANFFVHYSAHAAVRSAIVQIPLDQPDDSFNVYTHAYGRTKHDTIHRAAYLALLPIAGRLDGGAIPTDGNAIASGLSTYYGDHGRDDPAWIDRLIPQRTVYAASNTEITMLLVRVEPDDLTITFEPLSDGETHVFAPRDPVTVGVTHRFNLAIPWIQRIYADGEHPDREGFYTEMKALMVMNNEGIRDDLPPQPTLERLP